MAQGWIGVLRANMDLSSDEGWRLSPWVGARPLRWELLRDVRSFPTAAPPLRWMVSPVVGAGSLRWALAS